MMDSPSMLPGVRVSGSFNHPRGVSDQRSLASLSFSALTGFFSVAALSILPSQAASCQSFNQWPFTIRALSKGRQCA
ncbi:hypothetical protein BDN67DRAFT_350827 [Paxillus ammoniavirescens]|nr:hypothetical protein BDN67DRAFT_350827 [Paxillus ammoniavirescens]